MTADGAARIRFSAATRSMSAWSITAMSPGQSRFTSSFVRRSARAGPTTISPGSISNSGSEYCSMAIGCSLLPVGQAELRLEDLMEVAGVEGHEPGRPGPLSAGHAIARREPTHLSAVEHEPHRQLAGHFEFQFLLRAEHERTVEQHVGGHGGEDQAAVAGGDDGALGGEVVRR